VIGSDPHGAFSRAAAARECQALPAAGTTFGRACSDDRSIAIYQCMAGVTLFKLRHEAIA